MNLLSTYTQVLLALIATIKIVHGYLLLAATLNDVKSIAREFVPEELVEQLARAVTDLTVNRTVNRDVKNQQFEDVTIEEHSASKESNLPHFKAHKTDDEKRYVISKGKKINFEQLVKKVKSRLEHEIKSKMIITYNSTANENSSLLPTTTKRRESRKSSRTKNTMDNYETSTVNIQKPSHKIKRKERITSESNNQNKTVFKSYDLFIDLKHHSKQTSRSPNDQTDNTETPIRGSVDDKKEKSKANTKNRFKIKERIDNGSFNKNKSVSNKSEIYLDFDHENKQSIQLMYKYSVDKDHDTSKKGGNKDKSKVVGNKNKRFKIKDSIGSNNKHKNVLKKDELFLDINRINKQSKPTTPKKQHDDIEETYLKDSFEDHITPIKGENKEKINVESNKNNRVKIKDTVRLPKNYKTVFKEDELLLDIERLNKQSTPNKQNYDAEETTHKDSSDEDYASTTKKEKTQENKENNNINKNNKFKVKESEERISSEEQSEEKMSTPEKSRYINPLSKPQADAEEVTEDVYDDEFTIKTIASSEIKAETKSLGQKSNSEVFQIKPTEKLIRDRYKIQTPEFIKKTTSFAEKYDFDESIPENDRVKEAGLEFIVDPSSKINKKVKAFKSEQDSVSDE